jgi:hypothetical protein
MASKKRPPLAWDGKKPLPFKWGLYYNGKLSSTVTAYNVLERWYIYESGIGRVKASDISFIVKRLD